MWFRQLDSGAKTFLLTMVLTALLVGTLAVIDGCRPSVCPHIRDCHTGDTVCYETYRDLCREEIKRRGAGK